MSKIDQLRDDITYVRSALNDLHTRSLDDAGLTDDEWARVDEGLTWITDREQELARYVRLEQAAQAQDNPADGARDFQYQRKTDTTRDVDVKSLSRGELRDKALATLERDGDNYGLSDSQKRIVDNLVRRSDGEIAARLLVTETDAYRSAWMKTVTGQQGFSPAEVRALDEYREMNIVTAADGGYGVPVLIDPTILLTDQGTANPFLAAGATVKTITTKDWKGVSAAGVTWAFETESAAANDISPTLAQPTIYAHKAQGFIPYTIEVGMDYPEFAAEMSKLLSAGYEELLVDKFTRGSGTGEPWGIFEACEQATSQVAVTTDATFSAYDVLQVWKALPQKFRRNASWLMNVDVNNEIRLFGDDELAKQTVNLAAGAADMIVGRPVYESPYAPEFTGTTGASSILVVGDFANFYIAQRAGMSVEYVPHVFDTTTGTPNGQRGWYAWARVGSDSVIDNAFRMLVNT